MFTQFFQAFAMFDRFSKIIPDFRTNINCIDCTDVVAFGTT